MAGKLERQGSEDPLLVYANSVPGVGDSEVGRFVCENIRGLLEEAARMTGKGEAEKSD